jgi:hypothetical protein
MTKNHRRVDWVITYPFARTNAGKLEGVPFCDERRRRLEVARDADFVVTGERR